MFSKTVIISGTIIFILLFLGIAIFASLFSFPVNKSENIGSEITIIAYHTTTPPSNALVDKSIYTPTPDLNNFLFYKGLKVVVYGTGGEGLRIHQLPGQVNPTIFLANDGDLYIISDGPIITGGYVWWQIKSLNAEDVVGWAAQDYLQAKINSQ